MGACGAGGERLHLRQKKKFIEYTAGEWRAEKGLRQGSGEGPVVGWSEGVWGCLEFSLFW